MILIMKFQKLIKRFLSLADNAEYDLKTVKECFEIIECCLSANEFMKLYEKIKEIREKRQQQVKLDFFIQKVNIEKLEREIEVYKNDM